MEAPQNNAGQKLRWWQESETNPSTPWYRQTATEPMMDSAPVVTHTDPATTDLWEELEAEAKQRAVHEQHAVAVVGSHGLYRRNQMRFTLAHTIPFLVFNLVFAVLAHSAMLLGGAMLLLLACLYTYQSTKRRLAAAEPSIQISALGVTVDVPEYKLGPVRWDEIQAVSAVSVLGTPCVQIRLKDPEATINRSLQTRNKPYAKLYRWLMTRYPLQVDTDAFATPSKEIAAQIANFRP